MSRYKSSHSQLDVTQRRGCKGERERVPAATRTALGSDAVNRSIDRNGGPLGGESLMSEHTSYYAGQAAAIHAVKRILLPRKVRKSETKKEREKEESGEGGIRGPLSLTRRSRRCAIPK